MPAFGRTLNESEIKAVVSYLRELQGKRINRHVAGNDIAGRELFFGRAGCGTCHMIHGQGGFLGSDLSGYGNSHTPEQIRASILDPKKAADSMHGTATVTTRDGKRYRGIVRNEDNFSLQLQTPDGAFHLFDKKAAKSIEHEDGSLMPSDYGVRLSEADLDNLVTFLASS